MDQNKIFRANKELKISYEIGREKFTFKISNVQYSLSYPENSFSCLSDEAKKTLAENFIYSRTAVLGIATLTPADYLMPRPFLKNFIDWGLINDLPRISEDLNIATDRLQRSFKAYNSKKTKFLAPINKNFKLLPRKTPANDRAIIAISFGKDSLLTYGLAKEIGLKYQLVSVDDENKQFDSTDYKFKRKIFREFAREQKEKIHFLKDDIDFKDSVDQLMTDKKIRAKAEDLEHANAMITFILELLPFAYHFGAKYVIFGNERNFIDTFTNKFGIKAYPSFDQTAIYTKKENVELKKLTDGNLAAISLVEPIYNLAEMAILYHRYSHLLKYLMSCSPEGDAEDRWCYSCPMCAKAFLYSVAVGGDPKKIGFNKNFFAKQYQPLYPLLAKKISRYYEKPPAVREEQLLAFLLAYRQGARGELIELFRRKYLTEAEKKEKTLRKKFFGIYPAINIPNNLKNKVLKIYQEELKDYL